MGECEQLPSTVERYQARFARVLAHIESNSEAALSIDDLSGIAAFSRHHFHRQFSGFLGMSAYRYVQFMFRQYAGQSPSEFRAQPDWAEWHSRFRPFMHLRQTTMNPVASPGLVRVTTFPTTRVALLEHRGNVLRLGDSIRKFIEWRKANALPPHKSATFNIIHNDPNETPPEDFRFDLCAATDRPIGPNDAGVREFVIPGGRCALLQHRGSDDQLGQSIMHLYASWLPASGEELRDFPLFMQRLKFFPDVTDGEAETDIYLPLA